MKHAYRLWCAFNFTWCCYWFARWQPQYQTVFWSFMWVLLLYGWAYLFYAAANDRDLITAERGKE